MLTNTSLTSDLRFSLTNTLMLFLFHFLFLLWLEVMKLKFLSTELFSWWSLFQCYDRCRCVKRCHFKQLHPDCKHACYITSCLTSALCSSCTQRNWHTTFHLWPLAWKQRGNMGNVVQQENQEMIGWSVCVCVRSHLSLRSSPPGVREDRADDTLGAGVACWCHLWDAAVWLAGVVGLGLWGVDTGLTFLTCEHFLHLFVTNFYLLLDQWPGQ